MRRKEFKTDQMDQLHFLYCVYVILKKSNENNLILSDILFDVKSYTRSKDNSFEEKTA